ncbi:M20/M25/M40 family metallo-hydrolase [Cyclobacterium sp.]|uniref:M20/M25/M40 family metallo-hydrolase n=1 Tax=Cyclobacterium sp. TaxID=1966343 RepID=UPI00198B27F8|nr:M20/M25/M40 family metallo-hydrolase [Cyclobacterium sp.]MBD3629228.1 aminopeptidase [Cyclobacterium sp.]
MDILLKEILEINSVSSDESRIASFLLDLILKRRSSWNVSPQIYSGEEFHDNILLVFGNPKTAAFAHMDTVGFSVRYENQLVPIGGPEIGDGAWLQGVDLVGPIRCKAHEKDGNVFHDFPRGIQRGTMLSFEQQIKAENEFIEAAYLDNRLGMYALIRLCETLTDGIIVFSTYEEHGGGSMPFLTRFIFENWGIRQALVADVTWITEGVHFNKGAVISMRDSFIPRKKFLDSILELAEASGVQYQLEVEAYGGSDGREIQMSPYPVDWCFIGVAEENPHTPQEKASLKDVEDLIKLYQYLMRNL